MTQTIREYVDSLPADLRRYSLIADAAFSAEEMRLDDLREALLSSMSIKRAKPYLHAVETDELEDLTYDEVVRDLGSIEPMLGTFYLHIPFCTKRCAHCHYYKEIGVSGDSMKSFPAHLLKEASLVFGKYGWDRVVTTSIHYGGGTPSLLPLEQWVDLLAGVHLLAQIQPDDEVTIECSPEDVTSEKLAFWRERGINRVSLGTQSFDEGTLQLLNRNHNGRQSAESYAQVIDAGFENVNIDLMYGMPGRTLQSWLADVHRILSLLPESVTIYATRPDPADSLERFTKFPGDEERIFIHLLTLEAFLSAGYLQYSPNQFIRSSKGACSAKRERNRCHNVLGLGPLSHSIMGSWFYHNKGSLNTYQRTLQGGELCALKGAKMSLEAEKVRFMQFGLKLSGVNKDPTDNGVLKATYREKFGESLEEHFDRKVDVLVDAGLVENGDISLHLTKAGVLLNRDVVRYFAMAN